MAANYSICLGTAGWGVWHSPDAGKSWTRHRAPFPLNSRIQALVAHPKEAHTVLAGGDTGVFASRDGGARWERIGGDGALPTIWSLTIDPVDPDILFAGTRPAAVYRSRDGGRQWEKLAVDLARECSIGAPFVTGLVVDPDDHRIGLGRGGDRRRLPQPRRRGHLDAPEDGLYDPDIHAVTIAATQPKRLYASTAREMFVSDNLGDTWEPLGIKEKWPLPYARGMAVKADDPGVLFAGCGETTTGEKGHVLRTTDFGQTWEILPLPTQANATMWGLAIHPADANRIVAFSLFGEVYVTEDAGASWRKIAREFGEIRAAAWVPNSTLFKQWRSEIFTMNSGSTSNTTHRFRPNRLRSILFMPNWDYSLHRLSLPLRASPSYLRNWSGRTMKKLLIAAILLAVALPSRRQCVRRDRPRAGAGTDRRVL